MSKPTNFHGLRSRSSSANSGSGCTSPARSPRPRSPSPPGSCRDHLSNWSASVPALNAERHFENGHHGTDNPERLRSRVGIASKNFGKENRRDDRPEKPERRLNSKELIEKQKNWTSHFSKTRPSRYNSDPNRSVVQTIQNQNSARLISDGTSMDSSYCESDYQEIEFKKPCEPCPATRSASFCTSRPSPAMSPPPPLPPTRNSSAGKKERPVSFTTVSPTDSESPVSPEYATVNKSYDNSPTIPEYAVVQKGINAKTSSKAFVKLGDDTMPEYATVQKPLGSKKPVDVSKLPINSSPRERNTEPDDGEVAKKDLLEVEEYAIIPTSPVHAPPKTSEWRNVWLAKNEEILKNVSELKGSADVVERTSSRPDWAKPQVDEIISSTDFRKIERTKTPENELRPPSVGTDSASSSMSSPSSPSKDSKEEKAEKELPEKLQYGKSLVQIL